MVMSRPLKYVAVSAALGLAVIGVLAFWFRRRKPPPSRRRLPLKGNPQERQRFTSLSSIKSPLNGDIPRSSPVSQHSGSPAAPRPHTDSTLAPPSASVQRDRSDTQRTGTLSETCAASTLVGVDQVDQISERSPQHLCQLGLDSIQVAIDYWEEAISKIDDQSQDGLADIHDMRQHLVMMIERCDEIHREYERAMFSRVSTAALDSALSALTDMDRMGKRERRELDDTESDNDSFVSASEMADLSDFDEIYSRSQHLYLYDSALLELKHGNIPCRLLRTKLVSCKSDVEFLAKLHCIRLAFFELMSDETIRNYFTTTGKQLLIDMLLLGGKDTKDFEAAFEELMQWIKNPQNWQQMEEELRGRGVKVFSFYDVVLDFILMDSFDDLASPPSSVTTVTHNRWLSNGFKETALATAVWSVLKAKRRMLRCQDGFVAHFYAVSEAISPTLAWGFLGPEPELNSICYFFKDVICWFISDLFDFGKCRYTTVPELADDVMALARLRANQAAERLHRVKQVKIER